jgi:4,5-dihydroxyphthalate decarboxylase
MAVLRLSAALSDNVYARPILDGLVAPRGAEVVASPMHPSEMFWRQLRFGEFDISEMSLSGLAVRLARGDDTWVALPVFTTTEFFHTRLRVRLDSGIEQPADLAGKRVGVVEYQQTASVWLRGTLQDVYGVEPKDVKWVMERSSRRSHGGATGFRPPPGVELSVLDENADLGAELLSGRLDAMAWSPAPWNVIDRERTDVTRSPDVRPLFGDEEAEYARYLDRFGFVPVNHCVVLRRELVEQHPWLPLNVFVAFAEAKRMVREKLHHQLAAYRRRGVPTDALVATDPVPYGIAGQEAMLETLFGYLCREGLTDRLVTVADVFGKEFRELSTRN